LGWSYTGKDNGGVGIEKYNIKVSTDQGNIYTQAGSTSDASAYSFVYTCGATLSTFYFKITAVNGVGGTSGEGYESPAVGMFCSAPPLTPQEPQVTSTAATLTVKLYEPNAVQLNNAIHTGWRILVDDADDANDAYEETAIYDTTALTYTFTSGIITGHAYRVKTKLCTVVGCSTESTIGGPATAASTPAPPYPVYAQSSTNSQIVVAWSFSGSNGGAPILGWKVYVSADGETYPDITSPTLSISNVNTMTTTLTCATWNRDQNYLWVKIAGYSLVGTGTYSDVLAARCSAVPATPVAPTVVSSSTAHITITWVTSALNNALHTGTKVHFDDGAGGPFTPVTLSDTLQTEYTLMGVSAGQFYRFKVQSLSEVGESLESPVLTRVAAAVPEGPTVNIAATKNTAITYNWNMIASTGGSSILNWRLYASEDGVTYPTSPISTLAAAVATYTLDCANFNGVNRGQQYFWMKIAGVTAAGEGATSAAVKTRCSLVPGTPDAPGRVSSTANSVTISFNSNGLNGAHLTGFKVYTDDGNSGPWSIDTVTDTTARSFTKYALLPGLPYRFKVQVISEVGSSDTSASATHYSAAPADAPTVYVTASTNAQITVAWTPGSDGGSPFTSWLVYGSKDGVTWPAVTAPMYTVSSGTARSQDVSCVDITKWGGGNVQKVYVYFKVAGVNSASTGVLSNSFRWRCSAKPAVPDPLVKVGGTASSVTFSYTPSDTNSAILTGYKIWYDDGMSGDYQAVVVTSTSQTQYTVAGLTAGLPYRFSLAVLSEVGESDPSSVLVQTVGADADAPSAPVWQSSWTPADKMFTIGWSFSGSNGGAPITAWYVYLSSGISTWPAQNNPTATIANPADMSNLFNCEDAGGFNVLNNYFYAKVAAYTTAGVGKYSPISRIFCGQGPEAPTVANDKGTESSVTMKWAEGALYQAELRGYKIYINDGLGGEMSLRAVVEDTSQRYYTATGLIADRDYLVQVTVVSAVGESPRSSTLTARSCNVPAVPGAPLRMSSTATSIKVQWSAPADNGCPMTGYRLFLDTDSDGVSDEESYPGLGDPDNPIDPGLNPTQLFFDKTGVTTGNVYGFQLRAYNARGYSVSAWSYIKAAAEPAQMIGPAQNIIGGTSTSIALTWSVPNRNGGTMVGYKVFRDGGAGTDMLAAADPTCGMEQSPAPQACVISGLTSGDMYQIRMLAINEVGDGDLSDVIAYKAATVPAKITTLVNTEASFLPSLSYSWTSPADQGSAIFGFAAEVLRIETGISVSWTSGGTANNPVIPLNVAFTGDSANAVGLVRQRQYKFHVAAVNGMGVGEWSEWASLTDAPRGFCLNAPDTPLNAGRHSDTPVAGQVKVQWDAIDNENAAGGDDAAAVTYEVWAAAYGTDLTLRAEVSVNYYEQTVPSGQTWTFKIRAKNSGGQTSAFTAALDMVSAELPGQPATLSLSSTTATQVVMTWSVPTNGGSPITAYEVTNNDFVTFTSVENTAVTATLGAQPSGATLTYKVRARNAVGAGTAQDGTQLVL
jgi:hypothetical protein